MKPFIRLLSYFFPAIAGGVLGFFLFKTVSPLSLDLRVDEIILPYSLVFILPGLSAVVGVLAGYHGTRALRARTERIRGSAPEVIHVEAVKIPEGMPRIDVISMYEVHMVARIHGAAVYSAEGLRVWDGTQPVGPVYNQVLTFVDGVCFSHKSYHNQ